MVNLTRIYTRTGDHGQTRLVNMAVTEKTDLRVAAYGDVDEANAAIGVALASGELTERVSTVLAQIQNELFDLGADLGNPLADSYEFEPLRITADYIQRLEAWCDAFTAEVPKLRSFILPGGNRAGAQLHVARTITRRAERTAWQAVTQFGSEPPAGTDRPGGINLQAVGYLNRLSDLLFILSRIANGTESEVLWKPGGERTS
ncbi:cob(I)yrinic acid a,c-diamide adenosyltransferase [Microlunatus soli]|uniref:Corrinoid adenosyltransferase n=1 Tax=Microlunatus soli TaxID=630515 RepID=A0A1H1ZW22_9ACTN|nr:cob(I)yrinic acid a,c-diamide adenosyltransferase [Microlunatus soli]SDT37853.1 ATP:cob(I)alamin adenosyltransferase [Microlunatus soli]